MSIKESTIAKQLPDIIIKKLAEKSYHYRFVPEQSLYQGDTNFYGSFLSNDSENNVLFKLKLVEKEDHYSCIIFLYHTKNIDKKELSWMEFKFNSDSKPVNEIVDFVEKIIKEWPFRLCKCMSLLKQDDLEIIEELELTNPYSDKYYSGIVPEMQFSRSLGNSSVIYAYPESWKGKVVYFLGNQNQVDVCVRNKNDLENIKKIVKEIENNNIDPVSETKELISSQFLTYKPQIEVKSMKSAFDVALVQNVYDCEIITGDCYINASISHEKDDLKMTAQIKYAVGGQASFIIHSLWAKDKKHFSQIEFTKLSELMAQNNVNFDISKNEDIEIPVNTDTKLEICRSNGNKLLLNCKKNKINFVIQNVEQNWKQDFTL